MVSEQEKVAKREDVERCNGGGRQEFLTPLSAKLSTARCKTVSDELTFIIARLQWTECWNWKAANLFHVL